MNTRLFNLAPNDDMIAHLDLGGLSRLRLKNITQPVHTTGIWRAKAWFPLDPKTGQESEDRLKGCVARMLRTPEVVGKLVASYDALTYGLCSMSTEDGQQAIDGIIIGLSLPMNISNHQAIGLLALGIDVPPEVPPTAVSDSFVYDDAAWERLREQRRRMHPPANPSEENT